MTIFVTALLFLILRSHSTIPPPMAVAIAWFLNTPMLSMPAHGSGATASANDGAYLGGGAGIYYMGLGEQAMEQKSNKGPRKTERIVR